MDPNLKWFYRKTCKNCIYWLLGLGYESERIGRCVIITNSGPVREKIRHIVATGEDRFAFVDLPREEPVYTSDRFSCNRFIPNNERGRYKLIKYDKEFVIVE